MEFISHTQYLGKNEDTQGELSILFGGRELLIAKGYKFGPYISDFYDIQYYKSGETDLLVNDKLIKARAGTLCVIPPHVKVEKLFREDTATIYLTVKGCAVEDCLAPLGFSKENFVFPHTVPECCVKYLDEIIDLLPSYNRFTLASPDVNTTPDIITDPGNNSAECRFRRRGLFYMFISELMRIHGTDNSENKVETTREYYINKAVRYIENNYNFDINVGTVAKHVGLNRSYLYSIFHEELGISVRDFIIHTRIQAACNLLRHYDVPIKSVAASIRYEPVAFAHIFKKVMGMSAAEYRSRHAK